MDLDDFTWGLEEYLPAEILDKLCDHLPLIAKVKRTGLGNTSTGLVKESEIYILHICEYQARVFGTENNILYSLPVSFTTPCRCMKSSRDEALLADLLASETLPFDVTVDTGSTEAADSADCRYPFQNLTVLATHSMGYILASKVTSEGLRLKMLPIPFYETSTMILAKNTSLTQYISKLGEKIPLKTIDSYTGDSVLVYGEVPAHPGNTEEIVRSKQHSCPLYSVGKCYNKGRHYDIAPSPVPRPPTKSRPVSFGKQSTKRKSKKETCETVRFTTTDRPSLRSETFTSIHRTGEQPGLPQDMVKLRTRSCGDNVSTEPPPLPPRTSLPEHTDLRAKAKTLPVAKFEHRHLAEENKSPPPTEEDSDDDGYLKPTEWGARVRSHGATSQSFSRETHSRKSALDAQGRQESAELHLEDMKISQSHSNA